MSAGLLPNMRLKLTGGDRSIRKRSVVRWRARTIVQRHGALRANRPQLKRDPLGSAHRNPMTHPLQPLPDETPSLVPPPRLPPILRGLIPPSGGGGGGWRRPWRLRIRVLAVILLAAGATSIALAVWLIPMRAPTFAVAGLFIAAQFYRRR